MCRQKQTRYMCIFFVLNVDEHQKCFLKMHAVRNCCSIEPYGSNGLLNLLPHTISIRCFFFYHSLMRYNIPSDNCTLRSVKALNDPYGSNGSLNLLPPHRKHKMFFFFLTLPYEIQYTIRQLNSTEREGTQRSVWIERIVKPSAPTP